MKMKSIFAVVATVMAVGLLYTGCGGGGGGDSVPGGSVTVVGRLIDRETRRPICRTSTNCTAAGISVADVRVGVRVGTEIKECEIADKNKTSTDTSGNIDNLFNEAGYFSCDVSVANYYEIRAMATGYATYALRFAPLPYNGVNGGVFDGAGGGYGAPDTVAKIQDLGNLNMTLGYSMTINVVDVTSGSAVTGTTVYATPYGAAGVAVGDDIGSGAVGGTADAAYGALEVACIDGNTTALPPEIVADDSATADGTCILSGLNALVDYDFIIPSADIDGDGDYDYLTGLGVMDEGAQGGAPGTGVGATGSPTTLTIALIPVGVDDVPAVLASSCNKFEGVQVAGFPGCILNENDALRVVFSLPIQDVQASDFQWTLHSDATFVPAAIFGGALALDFNGDDLATAAAEVTITAATSAANTVLTLTPSASLTVGAFYTADGVIRYNTGGDTVGGAGTESVTTDLQTLVGVAPTAYIVSSTDTTVSNPSLDNYNSDDDGAAGAVAIEFDEPVYGSYIINAVTAGGATVLVENPAAVAITGATLSMINESNNNAAVGVGAFGCPSSTDATCTAATDSEAIKFAQTVGGLGALADNTTAAPVTATITIDVRDARGNELNTELTLPIQ